MKEETQLCKCESDNEAPLVLRSYLNEVALYPYLDGMSN